MAPPFKNKSTVLGRKLKTLELAKAVEILGNAKTFNNSKAEMIIVDKGVLATSKKTGKEMLIWDADLICGELLPETE